ncbi:unnamed protein product [Paramecium primaurelia]|uniref:Transmembrane protein n=1 Tax=Paramecium primaurelia TaxID=5886 RepID=A0A8S1LER7_PARPR|nr:unnamed protein product [Paramecium primaurelia]
MGLWAWTLNQMLTPKFWTLDFVKLILECSELNQDRVIMLEIKMGLFNVLNKINMATNIMKTLIFLDRNQRRQVNKMIILIHGILLMIQFLYYVIMANVYDEAPSRTCNSYFVQPFYQKPATDNQSKKLNHYFPQGTMINLNRLEFMQTNTIEIEELLLLNQGNPKGFEEKKHYLLKEKFFRGCNVKQRMIQQQISYNRQADFFF